MEKENFLNKFQDRKVIKKSRAEKKQGLNRRDFLKASAFLGASFGLGNIVGLLSRNKEETLKEDSDLLEEKPTLEQEKITIKDQQMVGETLEEQLKKTDKIILNLQTKQAIYEKWKKSYLTRPSDCSENDQLSGENHLGLVQALEKMDPWLEAMKDEFIEEGVPAKFAYLAIPESHFDLKAVSRVGAKGPFQFTKSSGKGFGLEIDFNIDERFDPIKSSRACAKHLKYSYEKFNNDWGLALADYNGGYTNNYAQYRSNKKDRNYKDYLVWREDRINKFIAKDFFKYKVGEGDTLTRIAQHSKTSIQNLQEINNIKGSKIFVGQNLKVPLNNSVKMNILKSSLENLNYPEKFYAVLDVIEEEGLEEKFSTGKEKFKTYQVPKVATTEVMHTVKKGEASYGIAREIRKIMRRKNSDFDLSVPGILELIKQQNKNFNLEKIYPGQKIKMQLPLENGMSLNKIAQKLKLKPRDLQKMNSAVLNTEKTLPIGMEIRIPKG